MIRAQMKRSLLSVAYPGWGSEKAKTDGYTVVVPAPMDMPFLTYFALRGLSQLDLTHCAEILVVPDGCGSDNGKALAEAVQLTAVDGVRLLPIRGRNRASISMFGHSGIAHWMTIVEAVREAKTDWIYLHDADAFFTDADLIESNHAHCKQHKLHTLGVTPRWDPYFQSLDIQIPGTWELMFSTEWAKSWSPVAHKAGPRATPTGPMFFDTMLYPQFKDHESGRIQVKPNDSFVHLSGTVVTYRRYLDHQPQKVGDELFRLLFLSLLQELAPSIASECRLPTVAELAQGLKGRDQQVHYQFPDAAHNYAEFRTFIERLMAAPLFSGAAQQIDALLRPFDAHFASLGGDQPRTDVAKMRAHGLWLG
jgi:hypothetical protein